MIRQVNISQRTIKARITSGGRQTVVSVRAKNRVKAVLIGRQGPAGAGGGGAAVRSFSFGDATPTTIFSATTQKRVTNARIIIENKFDGDDPSIELRRQSDGQIIFSAAQVDPAQAAEYEVSANSILEIGDGVEILIEPGQGASAGSGLLILETI